MNIHKITVSKTLLKLLKTYCHTADININPNQSKVCRIGSVNNFIQIQRSRSDATYNVLRLNCAQNTWLFCEVKESNKALNTTLMGVWSLKLNSGLNWLPCSCYITIRVFAFVESAVDKWAWLCCTCFMISPSGGGHPPGCGVVSPSQNSHRKTSTSSFSNNILLLIGGNNSKRLSGIYRKELV